MTSRSKNPQKWSREQMLVWIVKRMEKDEAEKAEIRKRREDRERMNDAVRDAHRDYG